MYRPVATLLYSKLLEWKWRIGRLHCCDAWCRSHA